MTDFCWMCATKGRDLCGSCEKHLEEEDEFPEEEGSNIFEPERLLEKNRPKKR